MFKPLPPNGDIFYKIYKVSFYIIFTKYTFGFKVEEVKMKILKEGGAGHKHFKGPHTSQPPWKKL